MGVAGSDQDSGSEHPDRPSRDVAGAGNSFSVGAFPCVSIGMLHRSPFGGIRLTIRFGAKSGDDGHTLYCSHGIWYETRHFSNI